MGLYSWFGFEKILGIGHILWVPLLAYVLTKIPTASDNFKYYLSILSVFIAISLLFDIVVCWKYFTIRKYALEEPYKA